MVNFTLITFYTAFLPVLAILPSASRNRGIENDKGAVSGKIFQTDPRLASVLLGQQNGRCRPVRLRNDVDGGYAITPLSHSGVHNHVEQGAETVYVFANLVVPAAAGACIVDSVNPASCTS